jgi:hypothetical protein
VREELDLAMSRYRAGSGCGEMPACSHLVTGPLAVAHEVVNAATSAIDELERERAILDATREAQKRRVGLARQAHSQAALG